MPAVIRTLATGAKVLIHTCDVCGSDRAPYGYMRKGQPSRWYCQQHRETGEAILRGSK